MKRKVLVANTTNNDRKRKEKVIKEPEYKSDTAEEKLAKKLSGMLIFCFS